MYHLRSWWWLSVHVAVVVLTLPSPSSASAGDRGSLFRRLFVFVRSCVARCSHACLSASDRVVFDYDRALSRGSSYELETLPLHLRLLFWTCPENCRYECMRADVLDRRRKGQPLVQYYGKWPFLRVLGTQEVASTIFSVANFVPHFQYFFIYRDLVQGKKYFMAPHIWWYSLISMNTWFWSAAFHARDNYVTERMDYFCTIIGLITGCSVALVRTLHARENSRRVIVPLAVIAVVHMSYMQFVHFNYGWNMTVAITVAFVNTAAWLIHTYFRPRPFNWKLWTAFAIIWTAGLMEVFDFPPFFEIFDAHSLWHGCTPLASYLLYDFLVEDTKQELRKEFHLI